MPVIVKRPRALSDLAEIWDYIADDSEVRADTFIGAIDAKFHTLGEPSGHRACAPTATARSSEC